jgi:CheY-like chemotaxis protein
VPWAVSERPRQDSNLRTRLRRPVLYPLSYEGKSRNATAVRRVAPLYHRGVPPVTVLVIDDDPVIVKLLQVNFELEGFTVITAHDGFEGVERAKTGEPDVVISDIMMPGMNGLELVSTLKSDPQTADLPVLLLSAKAQMADVQRGFDLGADDYVTKPFDPIELVEKVTALAAARRR